MEHQKPLNEQTENIRQRQFQIMERLADFSTDIQGIRRTLEGYDRILRSCCPNEMPTERPHALDIQGGGLFKSMFKRKKSKRRRNKSKKHKSKTRRKSK